MSEKKFRSASRLTDVRKESGVLSLQMGASPLALLLCSLIEKDGNVILAQGSDARMLQGQEHGVCACSHVRTCRDTGTSRRTRHIGMMRSTRRSCRKQSCGRPEIRCLPRILEQRYSRHGCMASFLYEFPEQFSFCRRSYLLSGGPISCHVEKERHSRSD